MGCDIHCYAERRVGNGFELITDEKYDDGYGEPFGSRSYRVFGFLADVRNYSDVPPIADRRGWPTDASASTNEKYEDWRGDAHSPSWLTVAELAAFDYDKPFEDRRVTRQTAWGLDGGCTAEPGGGTMTTYREFLGEWFFKDFQKLQDIGADRILFFFDN